MRNRLAQLAGLGSTMRKLESAARADAAAARDHAEQQRLRARQAHATAAAMRSQSGSLNAFLASRQTQSAAYAEALHLDEVARQALTQVEVTQAALVAARTRAAAVEKLTDRVRADAQTALEAMDRTVIDDMVAARAARNRQDAPTR